MNCHWTAALEGKRSTATLNSRRAEMPCSRRGNRTVPCSASRTEARNLCLMMNGPQSAGTRTRPAWVVLRCSRPFRYNVPHVSAHMQHCCSISVPLPSRYTHGTGGLPSFSPMLNTRFEGSLSPGGYLNPGALKTDISNPHACYRRRRRNLHTSERITQTT